MPNQDEKYIVEIGSEREEIAVDRFIDSPLIEQIIPFFGICSPMYCAFLRTKKEILVTNPPDKYTYRGDVKPDELKVLFNKERKCQKNGLSWDYTGIWNVVGNQLINEGRFKWPPVLNKLIGIEVKVCLACWDDDKKDVMLKSLKCGDGKVKKLKDETDSLIKMGFDEVVLLDVIVSQPASSNKNGQAWLKAGDFVHRGFDNDGQELINKYDSVMKGLFSSLPDEQFPVGHFVTLWGAVAGKLENMAGGGSVQPIRYPLPNPCLNDPQVIQVRNQVVNNLKDILNKTEKPKTLPCVILDCNNKITS